MVLEALLLVKMLIIGRVKETQKALIFCVMIEVKNDCAPVCASSVG
jgi:hypothetical protein